MRTALTRLPKVQGRETGLGVRGNGMAHIESDRSENLLEAARRRASTSKHVQHAQLMLMAAGLTAFGIVAVAAAMLTTLF